LASCCMSMIQRENEPRDRPGLGPHLTDEMRPSLSPFTAMTRRSYDVGRRNAQQRRDYVPFEKTTLR